jgi:hypothetical protein
MVLFYRDTCGMSPRRANHANSGLQLTLPFTVAVYMVRYFEGPGADEAVISRLTGLLVRRAHTLCASEDEERLGAKLGMP